MTDFSNTILTFTEFVYASLFGADFTGAKGLESADFRKADTHSAIFPDEYHPIKTPKAYTTGI